MFYSRKLKKDRIRELTKSKNFIFKKVDITNRKKLESVFNKKVSLIINLAAQAGVRYSLINPTEFIDNNITGFYKCLCCDFYFWNIIHTISSFSTNDFYEFDIMCVCIREKII